MDLPTYAHTQQAPPFDWDAFLRQPVISAAAWDEATELAKSWPTCACGNQCAALPRWDSGEPKDVQLATLGARFYGAVSARNAALAQVYLRQIEERSAHLLAALPPPAAS